MRVDTNDVRHDSSGESWHQLSVTSSHEYRHWLRVTWLIEWELISIEVKWLIKWKLTLITYHMTHQIRLFELNCVWYDSSNINTRRVWRDSSGKREFNVTWLVKWELTPIICDMTHQMSFDTNYVWYDSSNESWTRTECDMTHQMRVHANSVWHDSSNESWHQLCVTWLIKWELIQTTCEMTDWMRVERKPSVTWLIKWELTPIMCDMTYQMRADTNYVWNDWSNKSWRRTEYDLTHHLWNVVGSNTN